MKFTFFRNSKTGRYVPFEKEYKDLEVMINEINELLFQIEQPALHLTPKEMLKQAKVNFGEKMSFFNKIFLLSYVPYDRDREEIFVTENDYMIEDMLRLNYDQEGGYSEVNLHLHNSFESAYKEALAMRETHPACYE